MGRRKANSVDKPSVGASRAFRPAYCWKQKPASKLVFSATLIVAISADNCV